MEAQAGTGSNSGARPCVFMSTVGADTPFDFAGQALSAALDCGLRAINQPWNNPPQNCDELLTPDHHCTYRLRTELVPDDFVCIDRPLRPRNAGRDFGPAARWR